MLRRVRDWIRKERQWHRDHVEAWQAWQVAGENGLCRVQKACEGAIETAVRLAGGRLQDRSIGSAKDGAVYVHAVISPLQVEVWLYDDTVCFSGSGIDERLEEWDFRVPEEFVDRAASVASSIVSERSSGAV